MAKRIWIITLFVFACTVSASAQPLQSSASYSWLAPIWDLPVLRFFARPVFAQFNFPTPAPPPPPCLLEPLAAVEDPHALEFENAAGTSAVVNIDGLTPAMSAALDRFVRTVTAAGGELELKSAYRPVAYQAHLQEVWDKWMSMRNNRDPNCDSTVAAVQQEFERHRLLETQRPVTYSDHTRGNAFDASVILPPRARFRKRPVTLDKLARLSGVSRPDIARDPVHFRLIGAPSPKS